MLEADFQREYGIDLLTTELSWRKFLTLVTGLTGDSMFMTYVRETHKTEVEYIESAEDIARDMMLQFGRK